MRTTSLCWLSLVVLSIGCSSSDENPASPRAAGATAPPGAPGAVAPNGTNPDGTPAGTPPGPDGKNPSALPPPKCSVDPAGPVFNPTATTPALTEGQWVNISPPGLYRPRGSVPSYGCMDIKIDPCNAAVLYLTTDSAGMWRSSDAGATWAKIGDLPEPVSPGVLAINPADPKQMYATGGVRGASTGFWRSTDGGNTWKQPEGFTAGANNSAGGWTNDLYDVKADPVDFKHVLITFHSPFEFNYDKGAGVLESKDGGDTWTRYWPENWGTGHSIWFLNDSKTWLLGTQTDGYWRTEDGGTTWKKVSDQLMQHGGTDAFVSKSGVLYVGALSQILRSTDNGKTFDLVGPQTSDGYYSVVGDGNFLYTQLGNTGGNGTGTAQPYFMSAEDDGKTWTQFNAQTFSDGPYRMAFDGMQRIVYSSNWNEGVWALKVK